MKQMQASTYGRLYAGSAAYLIFLAPVNAEAVTRPGALKRAARRDLGGASQQGPHNVPPQIPPVLAIAESTMLAHYGLSSTF